MINNEEMLELLNSVKNSTNLIDSKLIADFTNLETKLGVELPNDYKKLCAKFGEGGFYSYLFLLTPNMNGGIENVYEDITYKLEVMKDGLEEFPEFYTYKVFPDKGGLLPFGYSDNMDYLCWVYEGEPNNWKIAVVNPDGQNVEYFDCNLIDFLLALWTTKDMSKILGDFTNAERVGFK